MRSNARCEPADPAIVRDLLGIPLGEANLAAIIGVGFSPKNAAEKLGIKEDTARGVLKKVYWKTGTSRQSELVALLAKLLFVEIIAIWKTAL